MMARRPDASLPQQHGTWAQVKAAYRWLSNDRIDPRAIGATHRQSTRACCVGEPVVLCVQDGSDLSSVKVAADTQVQHTTLALRASGELIGMLDQRWYDRISTPEGETRLQRASRWRESDVWIDATRAVGASPRGVRFVHVADRAADDLRFFGACVEQGVGFVVRARHDRNVNDGSDKLWSYLFKQPACGVLTVTVGAQRNRPGRTARVAVRHAPVRLDAPHNHPGAGEAIDVYAVHLREIDPPDEMEPIDWMLLSSEPVNDFDDAHRIIGYYQHRWVIEQWHRALKEGCRLQRTQLTDADALRRLAGVLSVVAVRLLQLRDQADADRAPNTADDPAALQRTTPPLWTHLVATLAGVEPGELTPRMFWQTIARQGGHLARRRDPRPGWKVLWRGFHEIATMIQGIELLHPPPPRNCG